MNIYLHYLPNLITTLRLFLTGPIIWALLYDNMIVALCLLFIAAMTDWLDGFLARHYALESELGAFLDPMADKVLLTSLFLTFSYLSQIPTWVVLIAVGRDALIVLGILIYRIYIGPLQYRAISSSKLNTTLQMILIMLLLLQNIIPIIPVSVLKTISFSMVSTSLFSFFQYAKLWVTKVNSHVQNSR